MSCDKKSSRGILVVIALLLHVLRTGDRYRQQETLLPRTDRATRYVSRNLVNCGITVRTRCTANPPHIEVIELEHCSRLAFNKLCVLPRRVDSRIGVVNKLDRRRVMLTTRSTCHGESF